MVRQTTIIWMMGSPDLPARLKKRYQLFRRNKGKNAGYGAVERVIPHR
jgi:hypothetical protein